MRIGPRRAQLPPERVQGFRHEERNIITGSPAVHGPVGDPLQIYADRFSGHYGIRWTHIKVLLAIARCRTAALGGQVNPRMDLGWAGAEQ